MSEGTNNTTFGDWAGQSLDASSNCNAFFGTNAAFYTTSGTFNTAVGAGCMTNNTIGYNNTAVGSSALEGMLLDVSGTVVATSVGAHNCAFGTNCLWSNQGNNNTGFGSNSLYSNSTGNNQTAFGCAAGFHDVSGSYNTFVGSMADISYDDATDEPIGTFTNSTAIGAGAYITDSNQIVMGTNSQTLEVPGTTDFKQGLNATGNSTIVGTVTATAFNVTSDHRIKSNVQSLANKYTVDNLNPVSYYNERLKLQSIGLIAHEVGEEYPELVVGTKNGESLQSVDYIGLIGVLIDEVKQLKHQVQELKLD